MKVVVAIDDSPHSKEVLAAACTRHWPRDVQFKVVSVQEPLTVYSCDCACSTRDTLDKMNRQRKEHLLHLAENARHKIQKAHPDAITHFEVPEGDVAEQIVTAALEWEADRILLGAHETGTCPHFLMGSVSRGVAKHAHCTVEIIKHAEARIA